MPPVFPGNGQFDTSQLDSLAQRYASAPKAALGQISGFAGQVQNIGQGVTNTITQIASNPGQAITGAMAGAVDQALNRAAAPIMNAVGQISQVGNQLASSLASADRAVSGILSGKGVPGLMSGGQVASEATASPAPSDYRIRIRPKNANILNGPILGALKNTNGMLFPYTPQINLRGEATYQTVNMTHANQDFLAYQSTPSMKFDIVGPFTAQNQQEALYVLACIHFLRAVQKMRFGKSSSPGMPPPVLLLSGYGPMMFNDLPVVVTGWTAELGNNIDYVDVQGLARVPTMQNISVSLTVQNTPAKLRTFDWDSFASGEQMKKGGWF